MAKTTKTTQTNKAAEMRATAEKALTEKRKTVRSTMLYGKIKDAIDKAIENAASEGAFEIVIPDAKILGELGSPDVSVGMTITECEHPALVAETLVEDLESDGYKILRLSGMPVAVTWSKTEVE